MKDIIQIDKNNRCVSANCIYSENDTTIEYEFENENERDKILSNINNYIYQDGLFIENVINKSTVPSQEERIQALENAMLDIILGGTE